MLDPLQEELMDILSMLILDFGCDIIEQRFDIRRRLRLNTHLKYTLLSHDLQITVRPDLGRLFRRRLCASARIPQQTDTTD